MRRTLFIREFLRDREIASVKATSAYVVRRVCNRMDLSRRRVVVEYGPGTGPFTSAILERMTPDSILVLVESNPDFADILREIPDRRVRVFRERAQRVSDLLRREGIERADYVLSGIPFSHLDDHGRLALLRDTRRVLRDDGRFIAYQSSGRLRRALSEVFPHVRVKVEPFHIPPIFILEAACDGNGRA
ncbi:MAG TPA: rRNA adenine N-6-methyltransferase family protein [Planctomycetota bacterium]|nr:rRNA adenine N-6-methyltransferase family protein [Planctomycetota bacterium]